MRWGVRDEMTDEHMTTALCMNELRSALMLHSLLLFFPLKRLSHEIFTVIFWLEWIYLGLNGNRFWFLNFKENSLILDSYFKY
jgi:hypothetical protein